MKALILAAGYARRLYPLTKDYPKPLLTVRGRPIIDYIMDKLLIINDLDEVMVVTNSKFISRFIKWAGTQKSKKRISLVDDLTKGHRQRRGAIGDMNFVINEKGITDDLLVIGGDNLFDTDLRGFLSFAKAKKPDAVIGVYDINDIGKAKNYGLIKLDRENKVIDFKEKPLKTDSTLVAMCLYHFPKERLGLIQDYINEGRGTFITDPHPKAKRGISSKHDATGLYIDWLRKKSSVYGFVFSGTWYDIGHHDFYKEAEKNFLTPRKE